MTGFELRIPTVPQDCTYNEQCHYQLCHKTAHIMSSATTTFDVETITS